MQGAFLCSAWKWIPVELDLTDAAKVTAALDAVTALEPRIIVDLSGLEFIDAAASRHARGAAGRPATPGATCCWPARSGGYSGFSRSSGTLAAAASMPTWQRQPPARGASRQAAAPTRQ